MQPSVDGLIREIRASCLDAKASAGILLRQVRFLAVELKLHELDAWAVRELNGYEEIDIALLPQYRLLGMASVANFVGPFGNLLKRVPIPLHTFPPEKQTTLKAILSSHQATKSIVVYEDLIRSSKEFIGIEVPGLQYHLSNSVYPQYTCIGVYGSVSRSYLVGLVEGVKNRIQSLTFELAARFPATGDDYMVKPDASLTNVIQTIIYGGQPNIAIASREFTQETTKSQEVR